VRDLSVLIPARNERYLKPTVDDVLAHAKADTEVIVVCDGGWPIEPLPQHPRLTVLYHPIAVGQRAATNHAARLSNARYVMKLDAHCSIDDGFDVKLIAAAKQLGEAVTQIPRQHHLHVFNWRCQGCGTETYQGPTPTMCVTCASKGTPGGPFEQVWLWERRQNHWRKSTDKPNRKFIASDNWRFDTTLHFQYGGTKGASHDGDICDVMSSLGACFFMSRRRFFELGGLDEAGGIWGQFAVEIALKSWLSGGRHVVNRRTWFAHFFRVGGMTFPYPLSGAQVDSARTYSRSLWLSNSWPGQKRPLSWLIEKFAPLPDWHDESGAAVLAAVNAAGKTFRVVDALTDTADSHPPSGCVDHDGFGKHVPSDAMSLTPIDCSGRSRSGEVLSVGNQVEMCRIAAPSVVAQVVEDRNVLAATHRNRMNQPSVDESMGESAAAPASAESPISARVEPSLPIPAVRRGVDGDCGEQPPQEVAV